MIKITRLRLFRFKHQISLSELHRHSGLSHQHISRLDFAGAAEHPKVSVCWQTQYAPSSSPGAKRWKIWNESTRYTEEIYYSHWR